MMRKALNLAGFIMAIVMVSCGSARNGYSYSEDKTLYDKVKKFKKHPDDEKLKKELLGYYDLAMQQHKDRIRAYRMSTDPARYDRIIGEYATMQKLSDEIKNSPAAEWLPTLNYYEVIQLTKEEAAAAWYGTGLDYLSSPDRKEIKKAYDAFNKAQSYVPGYKDADLLKSKAFEKSIVNVVVNPVMDNRSFYAGWSGSSYRNNLQESLVRDLGGSQGKYLPARLYTDWEARSMNIQPDWIVDLEWSNLYFSQPQSSYYNRNRSKKIEIGTDTSGRPVYQTVYATLQVTRRQVTAEGEISYTVRDADSRNTISWNHVPEQYSWYEEYATYSGDSRALEGNDWAMINNRNSRYPQRDEMVAELYRRIYPDLKNRLRNDINW